MVINTGDMSKRKIGTIWLVSILALVAVIAAVALLHRRQPVTLRGAILRGDKDPNKQLPIADVEITATNALGSATAKSDAAGFFSLTLPKGLRRKQPVLLQFRRKDYQPLDWDDFISDKIYVTQLVPENRDTKSESRPQTAVSNTRIRYSVKTTTEANIGSAVRTFEVVNTGNTPCNKQPICSPDGKWRATVGLLSMDAGDGNEFRNPRVSCIAGPCPFTKIELENISQDRRHFKVVARDWSDTTTFLLEAEVVHPMSSDMVRETYPVIFGRALNFSLPPAAEGPSIEAEIDGEAIVFPLGPDLILRWANCHVGVDNDQSKTYRCELTPGYRFR
jgi:hypothetical protein